MRELLFDDFSHEISWLALFVFIRTLSVLISGVLIYVGGLTYLEKYTPAILQRY